MDDHRAGHLSWTLPFVMAALWVAGFWAIGDQFLQGFRLDLGASLNAPTPGFGRFLALWTFFAGFAAVFLALGWARWLAVHADFTGHVEAAWNRSSETKWLLYGSLFGFLIPLGLRTWLLHGAPLTDDESAYRFMAEVLAQGRVVADSPPHKLFFDNRFLINDGKLYAHYFLGWPALLLPGVGLGLTGWMNALYSAFTVPALFFVVQRLCGSTWARMAILLYLASPLLMVAAATETAHTSCVAALAWLTWCWLRSRDEDAPLAVHAGVATTFAIAFFNRPTSALGIGLPLLGLWLGQLRTRTWRERWRALLAFALPALAFASLFLLVNWQQTGSPFTVAYQRAYSYAQENDFRFSLWPQAVPGDTFTEFQFAGVSRSLAVTSAALYRLNIDLFGWPCSFLFALLAGLGARAAPHAASAIRAVVAMVLSYLLLHALTDNVGIDTFAPMHYFELAWPVLLLSVVGLAGLTTTLSRWDAVHAQAGFWGAGQLRLLPLALAASLVLVSGLTYLPARFSAIARIADNIRLPWVRLAEAGIERAVIFAPDPFIYYCRSAPTRGWVFVRPNNDPQLENAILWVNHLTLEKDRQLMHRFPDRQGFVMVWDQRCEVLFLPLDQIPPGSIPDAKLPHFRGAE